MTAPEPRGFVQAGEATDYDRQSVKEKLPRQDAEIASHEPISSDISVKAEDESFDNKARQETLNQQKAETKRQEQANELRMKFHRCAWWIVAFCIASSAVLVGWQAFTNRASNALLIAFVSGVTVQVIGILAIVARYLFSVAPPNHGEEPSRG